MRRRIHTLRVRGGVFGIMPRLLLLALVVAGVITLMPYPLWQGIAVVAAVVAVIIPRSMAAWAAAACLPFGILVSEASPARTALALLLVHAIHVLGALSLAIPLTSRLALRALWPSAMRFVAVQLIAQPLVLGVWTVAPAPSGRPLSWLAPLAAAVLLLGVVVALRALKRSDAPTRERSETSRQENARNAV
ncbi:MAG TPA: hypothetical protein VN241_04515 [Microbacterium sp.]|nr:hypothetical protein [Microbacterium sp.]